jgi:hypothetical protein
MGYGDRRRREVVEVSRCSRHGVRAEAAHHPIVMGWRWVRSDSERVARSDKASDAAVQDQDWDGIREIHHVRQRPRDARGARRGEWGPLRRIRQVAVGGPMPRGRGSSRSPRGSVEEGSSSC